MLLRILIRLDAAIVVLSEELVRAADRVEDVPVVEVELETFKTAGQLQGQIVDFDEQDALKLNLLLCISLDKCGAKHFNHVLVSDNDALLVKSVLVHFELINPSYVRLLEAVGQR